jgi:hypothetical protein
MDEPSWIKRAKQRFLDLLHAEHAVVWPEVEAKLSEAKDGPQPHILTKARRELVQEDLIDTTSTPTRGGRSVAVWHLKDLSGRMRNFEDAAARKRLLYVRYLSWNNARTGAPNGFVGPAGERVVQASLTAAAPHGYRLVQPQGGPVNRLLGGVVRGGPLDNAAFLQTLDADGIPVGQYVVPIEVKNVRHWVYPSSEELYQLLYKSAVLQEDHPGREFVPVLICRRRSFFLWAMGKELGFFPIEVAHQYVLPQARINRTAFEEVRTELGYADLTLKEDAEPRLVQTFESSLPSQAANYAPRWKSVGSTLKDYYRDLRGSLPSQDRSSLMQDFRDEVSSLPGCEAKW